MPEKTFAEALREAIREEFLRDENVVLFGEDVGIHGGAFGVTKGLWDEFGGKQLFDTPLSEAAITGTAVGATITGLRPIAEIMYSDFITIAMDQIVNQAAKIRYMFGGKAKLPLVIRTPGGGGRGNAAQHSQSLEAWFVHIPGLKVVMPSTPYDAKGLLKTAIRDDNPVIFIEHKVLYGAIRQDIPSDEYLIPFGKGDIKREGKDVTLVATSLMVHKALKAADELQKEGINVEIIDPRTLFPLDKDIIINSVKKTGRLVVVHEAPVRAGIGAEIVAMVTGEAFEYLDAPPRRVGSLDCPIPYEMELQNEKLTRMYEEMVTIRKFEESVSLLNMQEGCVGVPHLYIGEESIAVGVCENLKETDYITSTHRGHGHCIAKGCDLNKMMAEIFGKKTGYCKGKGGSMHIADYSKGIIGANGIVAGSIPIATGCALSSKMRGTDQVTVCFFGDGASNQGAFHEALNLSAIQNNVQSKVDETVEFARKNSFPELQESLKDIYLGRDENGRLFQ